MLFCRDVEYREPARDSLGVAIALGIVSVDGQSPLDLVTRTVEEARALLVVELARSPSTNTGLAVLGRFAPQV